MNNVLSLTLTLPFAAQSQFRLRKRIILGAFWFASVVSVLMLLVLHVFQVNAETAERYAVSKYEVSLNEISKENKKLELASFQANSLAATSVLIQDLGFERAEKIGYIKILDNKVVSK
jgi:hypothetical protein